MAKRTQYNRIKEVLAEKGLTQADLADLLDVRYLTINNYCNNRRQPSIERLFEIAKVLKVSPRELIREH
jgi:transcriptional regulator with XRE-family HTH domain